MKILFNKALSKTKMTEEALEIISNKDFWKRLEKDDTDVEAAYLKEYVFPKIFIPRNREIAERFVSNQKVFFKVIKFNFLKNCDLTNFILEHKENLHQYLSLGNYGAEYKMSDEAAWALMNVTNFSIFSDRKSVWFRKFQNESPNDKNFVKRLEEVISRRKTVTMDTTGKIFNTTMQISAIEDDARNALNFHLNLDDAQVKGSDDSEEGFIDDDIQQLLNDLIMDVALHSKESLITFDKFWFNYPEQLINLSIIEYRHQEKESLNLSRIKVFKKYFKFYLESEQDTIISIASLDQLISIYEASR